MLIQFGQETEGVIIAKYKKLNGKTYVGYEFLVVNSKFTGIKRYNSSNRIEIGYKYKVVFYPQNPKIYRIELKERID